VLLISGEKCERTNAIGDVPRNQQESLPASEESGNAGAVGGRPNESLFVDDAGEQSALSEDAPNGLRGQLRAKNRIGESGLSERTGNNAEHDVRLTKLICQRSNGLTHLPLSMLTMSY